MNGSLALHVALALHGNPWLADPAARRAPALEGHSTFQNVRSFEADGATTTAAWFERLRAEGVTRLGLACSEPRNADDVARTAFAGVDPWALVADGGAWSATMQHVEGDRERPWAVVVQRFSSGPPVGGEAVAEATTRLRAALAGVTAVAQHHRWNEWSGWFGQAGLQLESHDPRPRFHADLVPEGLSLERRRLLAAAVGSWVFGGMGSWNDVGDRDAAYEEATVELYAACTAALMAAVNA